MVPAVDFYKRLRALSGDKADLAPPKVYPVVVNDVPGAPGSADVARLAEAEAPKASCGNCRRWTRLGRQWGKCGSKQIQNFVETEGGLVTRDNFQCCLHAPAVARSATNKAGRGRGRKSAGPCGS